jgi:hypothetical protein
MGTNENDVLMNKKGVTIYTCYDTKPIHNTTYMGQDKILKLICHNFFYLEMEEKVNI